MYYITNKLIFVWVQSIYFNMFMKRKAFFVLLFGIALVFTGCAEKKEPCKNESEVFGSMRLRVLDGMSNLPIAGAKVIVPETNTSYQTDVYGMTDLMTLPVLPDSEYDLLLPSNDGRITFIVTAEGYTPYLLLYARVLPDTTRPAPSILLFPDDGTLPVFTIIEAPASEWAAALVEKYTR